MFERSRPLLASLALASCLVSCDDEPAGRPTAAADAMWKLAPEGTHRAIVLSPYGLAMLEKGFTSLLGYVEKAGPELAQIGSQLDDLLSQVGGKNFTLATLGLTPTKGAAMFGTHEGMVAVLPIADRATFLAKVKGTQATPPDGLDQIDNFNGTATSEIYTSGGYFWLFSY